jgi:hypothetical protein
MPDAMTPRAHGRDSNSVPQNCGTEAWPHAHVPLALQGPERAPLLHLLFYQVSATRAGDVRLATAPT